MKSRQPFRRVGNVLLYENEPVFLAGCLPGNPHLPEPPETKLELPAAHRNNFFRHWMIAYYLYNKLDPATGAVLPDHDGRERNSPFFYDKTPMKWRLTRFNDDYFRRLRAMIEAAAERGIVVEISLFDAAGLTLVGREPDRLRRWPHSPFNATNNFDGVIVENPADDNAAGFPEWFDKANTKLRSIQAAYVRKVVSEVKSYWNVTFEIMNEPRDTTTVEDRVEWGDFITGEIVAAYGATPRKQLIFWNGHPPDGKDITFWQNNSGTYRNYAQVDGVTFHGDSRALDPEGTAFKDFRARKVFQASSDGLDDESNSGKEHERDPTGWHRQATNHCSSRDMMYQAWHTDETACTGIGLGQPQPSPLLEPAFLYEWRKVAEQPPSPEPDDFHLRFFAGRSYLKFQTSPYRELERGVVREYLGGRRIALYNATQQVETVWRYELLDGGTILLLVRESDDFLQIFMRLGQPTPEALAPFLFHWKKISENPPAPSLDDFHLRYFADGSFQTFLVSPFTPLPGGEVRSIQGTLQSGRLIHFNREASKDVELTYTFQGTRLTLVRVSDNFTQVFERFPRPAGDALVPLLYRWDKTGENPPSPVPDRFRLRFFADGSFTAVLPDATELERGEVRSFTPPQGTQPGRITLWSHTRSVETVLDVRLRFVAAQNVRLLELTSHTTGLMQTFRRA